MIATADAQRTIFSIAKLISPVSVVTAISVWHSARVKLLLLIFIVEIAGIYCCRVVQFSVSINGACSLQWKFWHLINFCILRGRLMCGLVFMLLLMVMTRGGGRWKWRCWCDDDSITWDGYLYVNLMLGG